MHLYSIKHIERLAIITLSLIMGFSSLAVPTADVRAATSSVSINMFYYGLHSVAIDEAIINANPEFLIGTSAIGPAAGNADINKFTVAGIKYFEYLTGGYETKYPKGLPVDLQSNLDYIDTIAAAGAYGIFFDEVSDGIWVTPDYDYLQQISSRARSLGLKVVFNIGVNNWVDQLMDYCDYIGSTEQWANAPLTASQQKWANRMWLLRRDGINDAVTAAKLTIGAWDKGVAAAYATSNLITLPSWLPEYISLISPYSPDLTEPAPPSEMPPGNTSAVVASIPVSSGGVNEYNLDITIMTTTVPGLSAGQTISVAGTTSDFPNLLVFNSDVTGNLDNSLGWWTLKRGVISSPPPPPSADTVIDISGIAGVAVPVTGGVPAATITETGQYTGTVTWSQGHNPFQAGTVYSATITLTAKAGFTLSGVTADYFTVAGATAGNGADSGVVTAVFPATAADDTVIDISGIAGVAVPVTGGVPAATITETGQYTGTVTWNQGHNPFQAGTVYSATITLTAKEGFTLSGVTADHFTVAGATAGNGADSGVVTAVFPATAADMSPLEAPVPVSGLMSWGLIVGILGVVLVIGLAVLLLVGLSRKSGQPGHWRRQSRHWGRF